MSYIRDMSWKRDPLIAKNRADLAKLYRGMRRDHPQVARLFLARHKAAQKLTNQHLNKTMFGL